VVAAHLFIFYFGCFAAVTPPVALSSYLAAAIAKAEPVKTALTGLKLAMAAFILPFVFSLSPELLLINTSPVKIIRVLITASLGVIALASALENYLLIRLRFIERLMLFIAAVILIKPGLSTDIPGLIILIIVMILKYFETRKMKKEEIEVG
jgi:TRAP-type uncharacterized transport system fused permease subunit